MMGRNIVLCADGTGNAYTGCRSNVARIVDLLAMDDKNRQVVCYDQGIGTDSGSWRALKQRTLTDPALRTLRVLSGPHESRFPPARWWSLVCSLAYGAGLQENVQQMYEWLAAEYRGECDRVVMFGFSRGAFTVRALAGLLSRCGLPALPGAAPGDFDAAWELYVPMQPDLATLSGFWQPPGGSGRRSCRISFLGVWDTVKAYGGFRPHLLPHLRHNPIVDCVCHAMALDERRGWYDATSWGWLDRDQGLDPAACPNDHAAARLDARTKARISEQQIKEVWFSGSHADVGGGNGNDTTSEIALMWMLAEAAIAGVELSDEGRRRLRAHNGQERPRPTDSGTWWWRLVDGLRRQAIDNSHAWPELIAGVTGPAERRPQALLRAGHATFHSSALARPTGIATMTVTTRADEALLT